MKDWLQPQFIEKPWLENLMYKTRNLSSYVFDGYVETHAMWPWLQIEMLENKDVHPEYFILNDYLKIL